MNTSKPRWLAWVKEMQGIAENGLAYSTNPFDIERFHQLNHLAAQIAAEYTTLSPETLQGLFEGEKGYATPKVDVRGAVFQGDCILLVRETLDAGRWTLPPAVGQTPATVRHKP